MGLLLGAGQPARLAPAAVRVALLHLHEHPLLFALAGDEAQHHDIHDSHELLVLRGVEHEARRPTAHLGRQLLQRLGLETAEEPRVDVVLPQHLGEEAEVARLARHLGRSHVRLALHLEDARALHALGGPPLVPQLRGRALRVGHEEVPGLEVRGRGPALPPALATALVLQAQALDELLAPRADAVVGAVVRHARRLRSCLLLGLRGRHQRGAPWDRNPGMCGHRGRAGPHLLALLQHPPDEVLTRGVHALGDLHLLAPHVLLVPEREAAAHQAVHDDTHAPDVHLGAVVLVEELRRPEDLRAHASAEPLLGAQPGASAKVRERDAALGLRQVLAVHQVVVPFDVPMHKALGMQVLDALAHLPCHVHHVVTVDLPALL
mmetsp:Transcript_32906/g.104295  ORF Transcript_32906/g.104295 Transcript_32906/m.104295 type:complete len:378 (-) Transcript_32906:380-1513(-)